MEITVRNSAGKSMVCDLPSLTEAAKALKIEAAFITRVVSALKKAGGRGVCGGTINSADGYRVTWVK